MGELLEVDRDRLTPIARQAVGDPGAWIGEWTTERLTWAVVNPSTAGLYRVSGTATTTNERQVPWVVVLKIVGDVDFTGHPLDQQYIHEPQDWNYWKREALAFDSGLLADWPGPVKPVRAYQVDFVGERQAWMWLEAVDGAQQDTRRWTPEDLQKVAYHLGAFAAQWASRPPRRADYPWLAQSWPRGWLRTGRRLGVDHAVEHHGCWANPLLAPFLPERAQARVRRLVAGSSRMLEVLESLPVTMAHHDLQPSNLFRGPDGQTIVIDWGFCGLAPVGVDLGKFIASNLSNRVTDASRARDHDVALTDAYLCGLREFGWNGSETHVRFASATTAALVTGSWCALQVSELCDQLSARSSDEPTWPYRLADQHDIDIDTALTGWAATFAYLLDLDHTARDLASRIQAT